MISIKPRELSAPFAEAPLLRTSGIRLCWEEITGHRSTWADILSRIDRYSLGEALDYLTRVSATLFNGGPTRGREQRFLADAMFGARSAEIWQHVVQYAAESGRDIDTGSVILFDPVAVALATKFALRNLSPEKPATGVSPSALGEALLMLNDHVDASSVTPAGEDLRRGEVLERWAYYTYVVGKFRHSDNWLHALARAYDLFLTDRPALRERHHGLDLPELLRAHTGLPADHLWGILFAFFSHFGTIGTDNAHKVNGWITRSGYFGPSFNFTREELDRFFALAGRDARDVTAIVRKLYHPNDPKPFHILPFEERPLVGVGDRLFAPLAWLLFDRLTDGIYHTLFSALSPGDRTRFTRYVGFVFEDYVDRLVQRTLDRARTASVVPVPLYVAPEALMEAVRSRRSTKRVCDGILAYDGAFVLLESKARSLPLSVRGGLDRREFVDRVGQNVRRSAEQFDATIAHIEAGVFTHLGIRPIAKAAYFPLCVSLSPLPMQPHLFRWVQRVIRTAGLLERPAVAPMELIHIGELEGLAGLMATGTPLSDVLAAKANSAEWWDHSFNNYALLSGVAGYGKREPYLESLFSRLTGETIDFLRSRGMPPSASPSPGSDTPRAESSHR